MVSHTDSAEKLIIGTCVSNLLITSSITLTKDPVVEVSATTKHHQAPPSTFGWNRTHGFVLIVIQLQ
ncbi:hypothetical protein BGZ49_004581, partial [Haplosporangium sp. Z 27]